MGDRQQALLGATPAKVLLNIDTDLRHPGIGALEDSATRNIRPDAQSNRLALMPDLAHQLFRINAT